MAMSEIGAWTWAGTGGGGEEEVPVLYPPLEVKAEPISAPDSLPSTSEATSASASEDWSAAERRRAEEAEAADAHNIGDCQIRNVVSAFNLRCHVGLRELAQLSAHVYYERSKGVLVKQMREPKGHIKVWASGKVAITGAISEDAALRCARKFARHVQVSVAPRARFTAFRISNILATAKFPFAIRVDQIHRAYAKQTQFEPELMVGLIWRQAEPKAVLRIHTTGSVTVTGATSTENVHEVLRIIYPIIKAFSCPKEQANSIPGGRRTRGGKRKRACLEEDDDEEEEEEEEEYQDEEEAGDDEDFLDIKEEPASDIDDDDEEHSS